MKHFLAGVLVMAAASVASAYDNLPDWVKLVPQVTDPAIIGTANAVVRQAATVITVDQDGIVVTDRRVAIEILRNEGSEFARYAETYNAASDKVLRAEAWIYRNGKEAEQASKSDWFDLTANADGAIIDETRRISVNLQRRAIKGDLVVIETKIRSKEFLGDKFFDYTPDGLPKAHLSLQITLPAGWSEAYHTFGPLLAPVYKHEGNVSRWTLPDVPFADEESNSAQVPSGLVVSLKGSSGQVATFKDWTEVGQYINRLQSPQCDTSAELQGKVRALTAGCTDDISKIRALGRNVQDLRYVAINRNLAIGHGYRPRLASEVFKTGYGDCKDKANLLRAMLREVGIKSQMVAVWVAAGAAIDESIPSPAWFNHAILAIDLPVVPDDFRSAVVSNDGKNYLIFDPTNRLTVMGDLAGIIQGARAFLCLEPGGVMITLPQRDGENGFSLKRRINVHLAPDGTAKCDGAITSTGQIAASLRSWIESSGTDLDLEKLINYQMSERFRLAVIAEKKYHDDLTGGSSQLEFSCTLPSFYQPIPGNKAVVKFDLFSQRQTPSFPEKVRRKPIQLMAVVIQDEVDLALGQGLEITDLPKPAELESAYGKYSLKIARRDAHLLVARHYELFRQVVPVEDYPKVKQYLAAVAKADRSAAMLRTDVVAAP